MKTTLNRRLLFLLMLSLSGFGVGTLIGQALRRFDHPVPPVKTVVTTQASSADDVVIGAPSKIQAKDAGVVMTSTPDGGKRAVSAKRVKLLQLLATVDSEFIAKAPKGTAHMGFQTWFSITDRAAFIIGMVANPDGGEPGTFGLFFFYDADREDWVMADDSFEFGL